MIQTVFCPTCASRITAPDRLAGKTVKCPKCQTAFVLPTPDTGFEVIEDDEPVVAKPKVKPPIPDPGFTVVEDDLPERPKPKKLPRKRIVEEEDDFLPLPRRRSSGGTAASHTRLFILLAGGLVFLAAVSGGLYYALSKVSSTLPTPPTTSTPAPPIEWTTFTPPGDQFTVTLPGKPTAPKQLGDGGAKGFEGANMHAWELNGEDLEYKMLVVTIPQGLPGGGGVGDAILDEMMTQFTARANPDPGVARSDAMLGQYSAQQVVYVEGAEHTILRATVVGNQVFAFVVLRKGNAIEAGEEGVKKYFDSIAIPKH